MEEFLLFPITCLIFTFTFWILFLSSTIIHFLFETQVVSSGSIVYFLWQVIWNKFAVHWTSLVLKWVKCDDISSLSTINDKLKLCFYHFLTQKKAVTLPVSGCYLVWCKRHVIYYVSHCKQKLLLNSFLVYLQLTLWNSISTNFFGSKERCNLTTMSMLLIRFAGSRLG